MAGEIKKKVEKVKDGMRGDGKRVEEWRKNERRGRK